MNKLISYISIFLYLVGMTAFQLGSGFDYYFVRISFVLLVTVFFFSHRDIRINSHLIWCTLFWFFYLLSLLWCENTEDTLYYINNIIQIVGIVICFYSFIETKNDIISFIKMMIFASSIAAVRVIILTPSASWGTERIGEAIGLNPNGLGMLLAISAILCIYMLHNLHNIYLITSKKFAFFVYLGFFVLFLLLTIFTGSKKSIIMLIAGVFIYELAITKGVKFAFKFAVLFAVFMSLIYLVFTNETFYTILGRRLEKTILTINGSASGNSVDGSLEERLYYMQSAKQLFYDHPFLGYGGNNFVSRMREIGYSHVAYCHNNYYEILCTLGILGFCLYYFEWLKVLISLFRKVVIRHDSLSLIF